MKVDKVNFVLCDDDTNDLEQLRIFVEDYINQRDLPGEALCFYGSEDVIRYSKTAERAVYLLDVIMPETDGIELGKKLRCYRKDSPVIYISNSREFALDAFSVHAFSYLVKPFTRGQLFSELDESLEKIGLSFHKLSVKTAEGTLLVSLPEIIAVEYLAHRLVFHLANGQRIEGAYRREPFDVQADFVMRTGDFLKVSTSYLINCRNVQGVLSNEFVMRDGSRYKITRKFIEARSRYINGEMSFK